MLKTLLQLIIPVVIAFLKDMGDKQLKGEEFSPDELQLTWFGRALLKTYGLQFAKKTDNTYDDNAVIAAAELAEDTLTEGGIVLTPIPDFGHNEEDLKVETTWKVVE